MSCNVKISIVEHVTKLKKYLSNFIDCQYLNSDDTEIEVNSRDNTTVNNILLDMVNTPFVKTKEAINNFLIDKELFGKVLSFKVWDQPWYTDHCPISLYMK